MWQVVDRIISMFIFLGVNVFANEYKFFDSTCYEYNTLFEELNSCDFYINYDTESDTYFFALPDYFETKNKLNYQLVIRGPAVSSMQNEYIDCKIPDLYFSHEQITQLYDALSEENIATKTKEYEEKSELEKLFQ